MNDLICHVVLLAQRGRLDSLSRGFRGRRSRIDTEDILTGLLILAAAVVAVWLLSYFVRRQERRGAYISSGGLFLSLCRAHRLRWSQRWLLWRVARAQRLRDPARLFLEPQWLEPARLSPALRARANELNGLRKQLFAKPKQEDRKQDADPRGTTDLQRTGTPLLPSTPGANLDVPPWTEMPGAIPDAESEWMNASGQGKA